MAIADWSGTPASNATALGVNIGEGCPPSNVNDAMRKIMADVANGINISTLGTFLASTTLAQARDALGVSGGTTSANNFFGLTHTAGYVPQMAASDTWTLTNALVPTGSIFMFGAATAPSGYLECNGAAVSRSTYAALYAIIGTTHGSGDGSTTFNLPDLRGEFVRGWDNSRGVDSGRAFGSTQTADVGAHTHTLGLSSLANISHDGSAEGDRTVDSAGSQASGYVGASSGTETRPRNVALLYCIRT
jgi:microcystin-dependent protein